MRNSSPPWREVPIGGVRVHHLTVSDLIRWIGQRLSANELTSCFYVNPHTVRLAAKDKEFSETIHAADVRFCDGYGVWAASRLLMDPLPERMTPPDWVDSLALSLPTDRARFFFLGDEPKVAQLAAESFARTHRHVRVVGHHGGFFDMYGPENSELLDDIARTRPAIVLVGMGHPRQEQWIVQYGPSFTATYIAVGALFRWMSRAEDRAPAWITSRGLEWLTRLVAHPIQLFDRYVIGLPAFLWIVLKRAYLRR